MQAPTLTGLPIDEVLDDVLAALADQRRVVVEAPTGAGKTTHVPLALLDAAWRDGGKIVVLEPRRLAARAAARRMSHLLGEEVGRTVGYVTRDERQVSRATRVEVVTEGILVRRFQRTPALDGVAAVLFDEFHERSLDADLGLAFALEVAGALRDDLRIAAMSATLDGARVAGLMDDAPVVASHGRQYPVDTHYRPRPRPGALAGPVAAVVAEALDRHPDGHVLAFLPGAREIRRTANELEQRGVATGSGLVVAPLYGALAPSDQDRALDPVPSGVRKIVLATDIAETSLTIEGVRIVIDSGLTREPRFEPRTGMSRLDTVRISKASADQRKGRAGRTSPGVCYRLWSEREHHGLEAFTAPEITQADLAPFALEVAAWGAEADELRLLDPPPEATYAQARDLLEQLGALHDGSITAHGRELVELPLHPRLAHMIVTAADDGLDGLACDVAALLADHDVLVTDWDRPCVDMAVRVRMLRDRSVPPPRGARVRGGVLERARRQARRLRRIADVDPRAAGPAERTGRVLARAYPDRIARRRAARGSFVLSNGRGAAVPETDVLAGEEFLVIADVAGGGREARVWLAAALEADDIREILDDRVVTEELVTWDDAAGDVVRARRERVGEVVLRSATLGSPPDEATTDALLEGIRREGLRLLPWTRPLDELRARANFLRRTFGDAWPDCSDEALLADLEEWLGPFLVSVHRRAHLDRLPLTEALRARIGWDRLDELERLAPERLEVPSGSNIRLDYRSGDVPVLAARVQELFGLMSTPTVAGGRVEVMLHLLSPAQRPVQVTRDLAGFWRRTYPEVRRELRGRYPKHHWPPDPRRARASRDGLPPR